MTIRKLIDSGSFGPSEIEVITRAYDAALHVLRLTNGVDAINELIAKSIVHVAASGERDPLKIAERAIRALGIQRPLGPE